MFPILPFIAGIFVGASAVGLVRKAKSGHGVSDVVENAGRKIRQTAVSGLDVIRQSSEQLRDRLASGASEASATTAPAATNEPADAADVAQTADTGETTARKPKGKKEAE
ncbi:MAG: hypothetical protein LBP86_10295 [Azoarcus sp.]|jgi:hypothetical protein|nr:hypothetical protein [Azoarcus sp.]